MSKVILWGGTGQARVDREILEMGSRNEVLGILDDVIKTEPIGFDNIPWYKSYQDVEAFFGPDLPSLKFVLSIGNRKASGGAARLRLQKYLKDRKHQTLMILHPLSAISKGVRRGDGVKILAYAYVGVGTHLGHQTIINTHASVDHDCFLADGVEICPGATVCGEVVIYKNATIGAGATILPRVKIGEGAFVGAGAVVTKNVAPHTVVFNGHACIVQEVMKND